MCTIFSNLFFSSLFHSVFASFLFVSLFTLRLIFSVFLYVGTYTPVYYVCVSGHMSGTSVIMLGLVTLNTFVALMENSGVASNSCSEMKDGGLG